MNRLHMWWLVLVMGVVVLAGVLLISRADGDDFSGTRATDNDGSLFAEVASYDLNTERAQRFTIGLFAADRGEVVLGTVRLQFEHTDQTDTDQTDTDAAPLRPGPPATDAAFILLPGSDYSGPDTSATFDSPAGVRGVYATTPIEFQTAGFWEVSVTADVDGQTLTTTTFFEVTERATVPGPGEPAPRTVQPLPGDSSVSPDSIDSRLTFSDELNDELLHTVTVADAIEAGTPILVLVSTPTFCVSRFCGPITDEVAALAARYSDGIEYAHLEVWRDFESNQINPAAAEWIARDGLEHAAEPWAFLVDGDGIIVARWDNVVSKAELEQALDDLLGL